MTLGYEFSHEYVAYEGAYEMKIETERLILRMFENTLQGDLYENQNSI